MFVVLSTNDVHMHLINFVQIYTSSNLTRVDQEDLRLKLLPFPLTGEAILWLGEQPHESITTWN